jgi:hypothetical protein
MKAMDFSRAIPMYDPLPGPLPTEREKIERTFR